MRQKQQQKLYDAYPKIFADAGKPVDQSPMAFGIQTGDGWFWLINHLCRHLQDLTDKRGLPQVVAFQVKEKFGGLRFYVVTANIEQYHAIEFAESLSFATCEECGAMEDVKRLSKNGWLSTRCDKCLGEES